MKYLHLTVFILVTTQAITAQAPFSKNIDVDGYSDGGNSVHQMANGYQLTATSLCNNNVSECFTILYTDEAGNVTKQVQYQNFPWWILAGTAHGNIGAIFDEEAGRFFSGTIQSGGPQNDIFMMKTDEQGDSLWMKTYGTSIEEGNRTLIFDSDSSIMLLNTSIVAENKHVVWLIRVDLDGNILWEGHLGEAYKSAIYQDIIRLDNGDIMVSYLTTQENEPSYPFSMTVTRLDPQGNEKWTSRFASYNGSILGTTSCIMELDNGGFLVNYKRWELTGFYKYPPILVWLDSLGSVTGQHDFSDFTELIATDLIKTSDGLIVGCGYADLRPPVMGTTDYGFAGWVFAFTQEGEKLWERYIVDLYYPDKFSYFSGLEETADKGFILTGGIQVPGAMHDIWLVKLDSMGCLLPDECAEGLNVLTEVGDIVNEGQTGFKVFPNPVSQGMLYIEGVGNGYGNSDLEISISDIAGRVVKKLPFEGQLDVSDLQKGVYIVTVNSDGNKVYNEKVIILQK